MSKPLDQMSPDELIEELKRTQGPGDALFVGGVFSGAGGPVVEAKEELVNEMVELMKLNYQKEKEFLQKYSEEEMNVAGIKAYMIINKWIQETESEKD